MSDRASLPVPPPPPTTAAAPSASRATLPGAVISSCLVAATAAGGVTMVATLASTFTGEEGGVGMVAILTLLATGAVVFGVVGLVIMVRRPGNRLGWLLSATGPAIVITFSGFAYSAIRTLIAGPDDPVAAWAGLVATTSFYPLFLLLAGIAILFPDGHLPSPRWLWPARILVALVVSITLVGAVAPGPVNVGLGRNPLGLELPAVRAAAPVAEAVGTLGILAGMVMGAVAVAVRYRRARGAARQQQKWFLAASAFTAATLPLSFADGSDGWTIFDALAMSSLILLPVAIGIAVLRYRLYEIDRIISRSVGWAILSGSLVVVFAVGVVALQALLAGFTQRQTLAVAASTLVAFALFQPIRRRVQSAVDRRFDRARYDGERAVAAFAEALRGEVDLAEVVDGMRATVETTVRPVGAAVWLRGVADAQSRNAGL